MSYIRDVSSRGCVFTPTFMKKMKRREIMCCHVQTYKLIKSSIIADDTLRAYTTDAVRSSAVEVTTFLAASDPMELVQDMFEPA